MVRGILTIEMAIRARSVGHVQRVSREEPGCVGGDRIAPILIYYASVCGKKKIDCLTLLPGPPFGF